MFFLAPFSFLYYVGLLADKKIRLFFRKTLEKPVISIGNLTVGGTGKTPLVIKLLCDLKAKKFQPAVLTRGYKELDEPRLIQNKHADVYVGYGPDRYSTAQRLLCDNPIDVFVLDDGFQHWPLARNLDIVCIDATNPWGGGHLLPWGRLREPLSALKRAQAVVITRTELVGDEAIQSIENQIRHYAPLIPLLRAKTQAQLENETWEKLADKTVLVFSGIGNPAAFEELIRKKAKRVVTLRYRDHHRYTKRDARFIEISAEKENAILITTEKDAVKFQGVAKKSFLVCRVDFKFDAVHEKIWQELIEKVMA